MERKIYEVYAKVVDATGSYNTLSGYPKAFDSRSYNDDINKALLRATGEFAETWGAMCKRDDRQLQMVFLISSDGWVIDSKRIGELPEIPEPEPTPDPEPEGGEG